jgi:hypothetical protein
MGVGMPAGNRKVACCVALLASCALAQQPGPYNPDPNHIWNRVHRVLHVRVAGDGREYGLDELDPLLWLETDYLLRNLHGYAELSVSYAAGSNGTSL